MPLLCRTLAAAREASDWRTQINAAHALNEAVRTPSPAVQAVLEETLGDCSITMRSSFDALDGAGDDAAAAIDTLQSLCDDVTSPEIVAEMARLQAMGCQLNVDGVGEEEVVGIKPVDCVDT